MEISYTSPWFYFIIITILVFFANFFLKRIPFYNDVLVTEEKGRFETLDGLRGVLALNVFFQHAMTIYYYFQTGVWKIVEVKFYRFLGGEAVILFFIMTSFLYWSKMIAQRGEVDEGYLYRSRFLRLAPMYVFCAMIIIFSILITSYFSIDFRQTAKDILSWLTVGLITTTEVNHWSVVPVNAGIHWTLHFEWFFYLMLPILAIFLRNKKMLILALPIFFYALSSSDRGYWAIFLFGIIAAHIYNKYPKISFSQSKLYSILPLVGVILIYFMNYKAYSMSQYFISMFVFLSFAYGVDFFSFFKTQVARFLGTISYSIYLIHGIILFSIMNTFDYFYSIENASVFVYWSLILLCGVVTIIISSVTYRFVEYPFIKMIKNGKTNPTIDPIEKRIM